MKVVITADFSENCINQLNMMGHEVAVKGYGVDRVVIEDESEVIDAIGDADILIVGYEKISQKVLESTNLKVICSIRGGPEANIDTDVATLKGIPVLYTKGREAIPVAEFTLGQILSLTRHITRTDRELRNGKFVIDGGKQYSGRDVVWGLGYSSPWDSRKGIELFAKTVGIIGFGTIGQEVCKRLLPFGTRILVFDPYVRENYIVDLHATPVDLDTLLSESDLISIHSRSTPSNKGMIGEREIGLMKRGVFLVNNSRAALIDEAALRDAVRNGKFGGLALDVHHKEPLIKNDELFNYENIILTPHIAGASVEVMDRHSQMLVDDLTRLLSNQQPLAIFNPTVLDQIKFTND